MVNFIKLTLATSNHTETMMSQDVAVNVRHIVLVEDYQGPSDAHSRVLLESGKSLLVLETQDEIMQLGNSTDGVL